MRQQVLDMIRSSMMMDNPRPTDVLGQKSKPCTPKHMLQVLNHNFPGWDNDVALEKEASELIKKAATALEKAGWKMM